MKAWAIVHIGESIKSQLKQTDSIAICRTREEAKDFKDFDEKIVKVEIKEL